MAARLVETLKEESGEGPGRIGVADVLPGPEKKTDRGQTKKVKPNVEIQAGLLREEGSKWKMVVWDD